MLPRIEARHFLWGTVIPGKILTILPILTIHPKDPFLGNSERNCGFSPASTLLKHSVAQKAGLSDFPRHVDFVN